MIQIQEKRGVGKLTVVHKMGKTEQISRIELDIIRKGEIPALEPVQITSSFFGRQMYFVIKEEVSLPAYLRRGIVFGEFVELLQKIIGTMMSCEAHGIRVSNLELRPKYLFYHPKKRQIKMLYWPLISVSEYVDGQRLFWALGNAYVCRPEDRVYKDRYMANFTSRSKFDLLEFEKALGQLNRMWLNQRAIAKRKMQPGRGKVAPGPDTLFAAGMSRGYPVLLHVATNTKIELRHFPFSLGRSGEECDFELKDNYFASRKHLILRKSGNKIYAVDNKSLNGTVIEGKRLTSGAAMELRSGYTIIIGKEKLIFFAASNE